MSGSGSAPHEKDWVPDPVPVDRTPTYTVETRERGKRLKLLSIKDPFVNTRITPRGWRVALDVLLRRYEVSVHVSGDLESVERVCYLDPDYLGAHGSERRASWDRHFNRALGDSSCSARRAAKNDDV